MRQNLNQKKKELIEVQKARIAVGLAPLKMGVKNCLMCDQSFETQDMKNQHICDHCRLEDNIDRELDRYAQP